MVILDCFWKKILGFSLVLKIFGILIVVGRISVETEPNFIGLYFIGFYFSDKNFIPNKI